MSQQQNENLKGIASKNTLSTFTNSAVTQPTKQTEATLEKQRKTFFNLPYRPKFIDSENLFPQVVSWTKLNSATNGAIINSKKSISKGAGFEYLRNGEKIDFEDVKNTDFLNSPSKEPFYDVSDLFEDMLNEFITHGEIYGICKRVKIGSATSFTVKILDTNKCRLMRDDKRIMVNSYWDFIKCSQTHEYLTDKYTDYYDLWDFTGTMPNKFAFHYRRRENGYDYYGVPDYWAGAKDAVIEYMVRVFNNSRLDNGQFTQAYITYIGQPPEGETPEVFLKKQYEKMGGAHNAGKPFTSMVNAPEAAPQINFSPNNNEGEFLALEKSAFEGIVRAHRWFPSLAGIATSGSLGSNQQIRNEYSIAINQVVPDYQNPMMRILNKLLELAEVDAQLKVINKSPISFDDQINPELVLTVNEYRELMKKQPLPEDYMYEDMDTNQNFGDMLIQDMKYKLNVSKSSTDGNN